MAKIIGSIFSINGKKRKKLIAFQVKWIKDRFIMADTSYQLAILTSQRMSL
jgi:hypothetical protein